MDGEKGQLRYASVLSLLIACALFLAARLIYLFVADPERFPISTVKIAASYHHISHKQLEEVLEKYLNDSFFSLPVGRLHTELSAFEWTRQVHIERVWPDTLKITLVEKIPFAKWNDAMLTEDGEMFNEGNSQTDMLLPELSGPSNQYREVLQVYKKMSKILSIYGLHASSLELRDNHAWELGLDNGVQLRLGKRDLEKRILRFCKAYPAVFAEKSAQLASVDLRYPRGMAVQWKNEAGR
ncbi:cell division protein FtsQ [Legionella quinlivanii]|uniref:Cell division protein FtsQ n=1 Tax=Legionella quinlivanii TaxID=45073 RepID=A0A0W0Y6M4_9GAMM|nr:cell division protein FtsQ/DivIB [Legionella quinlivanii]KTD52589.1 cell division protein FtsQ [Legionella quinlivanii]MCW8449711.1 cell division protein FtsQ/DivIB [Legionella quinlivanii]SEF71462.1 cell division protein FtsQ [Legionella quinlivanii DSM 21216]STY12138.1 cell division protein FtsQ [Legionella quinlivanii]